MWFIVFWIAFFLLYFKIGLQVAVAVNSSKLEHNVEMGNLRVTILLIIIIRKHTTSCLRSF